MRLLVINHVPVFAGPHNHFMRLREPLAARGWETVVALPEEPGNAAARLRSAGVHVVQLPLHRLRARLDPRLHAQLALGFVPEVRALRRLIRNEGIDLVLIASLENPHGAVAARMEEMPLVWQIIGTKTPPALRLAMMPMVTRLADVVMTTGVTIARAHRGVIELGERFVPFFTPVDTEVFKPDSDQRARAREELGLPLDSVVVGKVSNLNPQKGHTYFIRAAARLRERHPDVRFVLLGSTYETHPGYAEGLWELAGSLGLEMGRDLLWRNPGARVAELLPAFDVFWMTSVPRSEGVPTVVMEAMAVGMPVVTTDVGGVRDIVENGRWGFVVPPLEAEAIADATEPLIEDAGLRAAMSRWGRDFVQRNCRTEVCLETHLRAFDVALARRGSTRAAPAEPATR